MLAINLWEEIIKRKEQLQNYLINFENVCFLNTNSYRNCFAYTTLVKITIYNLIFLLNFWFELNSFNINSIHNKVTFKVYSFEEYIDRALCVLIPGDSKQR